MRLRIMVLVIIASLLLVAPHAAAKCVALTGVDYGDHMVFNIGGQPLLAFTTVVEPSAIRFHGNSITADEWFTVEFADGGSFDIVEHFSVQGDPFSGMAEVTATGYITNGTGRFTGVSGQIVFHGPYSFVLPDPWDLQYHGNICGL